MNQRQVAPITLDYEGADGLDDILNNLSGAAFSGRYLWTASDEGRSIECLKPDGDDRYRLHKQHFLDDIFSGLPDLRDSPDDKPDEADIESLAATDGALWVCGSHCMVRRMTKQDRADEKAKRSRRLRSKIIDRPSRHLLGRVQFKDEGSELDETSGEALPFKGRGTLCATLGANHYLEPFMDLPSKENGLDIEGMTTSDGRTVFIGLRGPLIDGIAVVMELTLTKRVSLSRQKPIIHFLDLDGLAVRDLAHAHKGDAVFILAGPVGPLDGPFRLYRWHPEQQKELQKRTQRATLICSWPADTDGHPEAICRLDRGREHGLLVLYDSPKKRITGSRYTADWIPV
jgi:uncharacterized protein DUF3616